MSFDPSTPNWKLVLDALKALGGTASIREMQDHFRNNFPPEKRAGNVPYDAAMLAVNANSRVHYSGGKTLRKTDSGNHYDRLFRRNDGRYEFYDPAKHGVWEIALDAQGSRFVRLIEEASDVDVIADTTAASSESEGPLEGAFSGSRFALESHLRDYLAQNLTRVRGLPSKLELFANDDGQPGVEFRTDVGNIDILAKDEDENFYVIELKVGRGPDAVIGQILRYMAWVRAHLANGKAVFGVVVTAETSEKLRYAASEVKTIFILEYELQFLLRPAAKLV